MKALDIYLAVCFFMVFGALLEYATVTYSGKRIKLNMRRFEELEKQIKEAQTDTTSVRAGDAPYFDQLIHDTRKKAAESGYRPAKEGED